MRQWIQTLKKILTIGAVVALFAANYSERMLTIRALPDTLRVSRGTESPLAVLFGDLPLAATVDTQSAERLSDVTNAAYTFKLFGVIPFKTVQVVRTETVYLTPGGNAVGITLYTDGVLVVGLGSVDTADGAMSPAAAAGLQSGDTILAVNGERLKSARHLGALCAQSNGEVALEILRRNEQRTVKAHLAREAGSDVFRLGAWVRDSTAGVGTLSFYSEETLAFAALGHAVSDIDTQSTLTVGEGRLLFAEIVDVIRGEQGEPGELLGVFDTDGKPLGKISENTDYGIYGLLSSGQLSGGAEPVPLAYAHEAHVGGATLLSTVEGNAPTAFACEIIRVNAQQTPSTKGLIVAVTDERLLARTGGIVQGMSGSPILQDGKLIGVVTHVFVNDPTRGYCVYAEWMAEQMVESAS